jgi:hypothetical protein
MLHGITLASTPPQQGVMLHGAMDSLTQQQWVMTTSVSV